MEKRTGSNSPAKELGVKMSFSSDAHEPEQLKVMNSEEGLSSYADESLLEAQGIHAETNLSGTSFTNCFWEICSQRAPHVRPVRIRSSSGLCCSSSLRRSYGIVIVNHCPVLAHGYG